MLSVETQMVLVVCVFAHLPFYFDVTGSNRVLSVAEMESLMHAQEAVCVLSLTCPTSFIQSCCFLIILYNSRGKEIWEDQSLNLVHQNGFVVPNP